MNLAYLYSFSTANSSLSFTAHAQRAWGRGYIVYILRLQPLSGGGHGGRGIETKLFNSIWTKTMKFWPSLLDEGNLSFVRGHALACSYSDAAVT